MVGVSGPKFYFSASLLTWHEPMRLNSEAKKNFNVVIGVTFWSIWQFCNNLVFGKSKPRKDEMFDDIRSLSYFWVTNRRRNFRISWDCWLSSPKLACNSV